MSAWRARVRPPGARSSRPSVRPRAGSWANRIHTRTKTVTAPITIGAIAIATVGLYLWYDGTGVMQDVLEAIFVREKVAGPNDSSGTIAAVISIFRYILVSLGLLVAPDPNPAVIAAADHLRASFAR